MKIVPNKTGGRTISGNTPFGDFNITLDEAASGHKFDIVVDGECVGDGTFTLKIPPGTEGDTDTTLIGNTAKAAKSLFKTVVLRQDRTDQDEFTNRISICRACEFSKNKRNGDPFSCGPMLESMANPDIKTCGCILKRKARDKKENCPMGFWPEIVE